MVTLFLQSDLAQFTELNAMVTSASDIDAQASNFDSTTIVVKRHRFSQRHDAAMAGAI